eukprot:TRINITY_DN1495_c0_g1_i1.p1 TRINITY_DN1495_c0_g1~~TRINITY_DN1495_c0_g1_i1.p1  ORF type:complete len:114 (-),score=9.59 TRINITY_DN1495_c0_g1_i1:649-990(-)
MSSRMYDFSKRLYSLRELIYGCLNKQECSHGVSITSRPDPNYQQCISLCHLRVLLNQNGVHYRPILAEIVENKNKIKLKLNAFLCNYSSHTTFNVEELVCVVNRVEGDVEQRK